MTVLPEGIGLGWRPETAALLRDRTDLVLSEVIVENFPRPLPAHAPLLERGVVMVPHGVSLGLGDASRPDPKRLRRLADAARAYQSPLVSEHIAFVRGGGREAGHLLPVPRTRDSLRIVIENVRAAQAALPVPLALENIAAPLDWPGALLDEADFFAEIIAETGALMVLDLANLYANMRNRAVDIDEYLDRVPLGAVAYMHIAGGHACGGWYHDTHAHPVPPPLLALLAKVRARGVRAPVLLERDRDFPTADVLHQELDAIAAHNTASGAVPAPPPCRRSHQPAGQRAHLAERQAALVDRLVGQGADPAGFDAGALRVTAGILASKAARHPPRKPSLWQRLRLRARR